MTARTIRLPVFTALAEDECHALLERNNVGRLAFLNRGFVDIEPVHYVADGDWLFIRSGQGTKLNVFSHHPYVAFEVDEIDATFDWRSVVAHGTVYLMSEQGVRVDAAMFDRAVRALRRFIPETMTQNDPTPSRRQVYGVHVDKLSGRAATSRESVFCD